jgi:DNA-binding transcriptional LysR family regulator
LLIYQLAEEPLVVCMPSTHRLAGKAAVRPRDLEGEPIVAISRETCPALHRQIEDFFEDFGIELNIVADAFGPPEAIAMAEQRVGLCLVAASSLRTRSSVAARTLSPRTLTRRCGLFVREDNRHPLLKSLVDLLLEKTATWRTIQ